MQILMLAAISLQRPPSYGPLRLTLSFAFVLRPYAKLIPGTPLARVFLIVRRNYKKNVDFHYISHTIVARCESTVAALITRYRVIKFGPVFFRYRDVVISCYRDIVIALVVLYRHRDIVLS